MFSFSPYSEVTPYHANQTCVTYHTTKSSYVYFKLSIRYSLPILNNLKKNNKKIKCFSLSNLSFMQFFLYQNFCKQIFLIDISR